MPTSLDRPLRAAAILLLLALSCATQAADWKLETLLGLLAQQKTGEASFVETKTLAVLDAPVESSGTLSFRAPDFLEKRTLKPRAELMRLEGDQLSIEQSGKAPVKLKLSAYPEAAAFVDSIRATLAGDRKALDATYFLSLNGSAARWNLILQPRFSRMSDLIQRIVISGSQADVQRIAFEMADGDKSEMRITRKP